MKCADVTKFLFVSLVQNKQKLGETAVKIATAKFSKDLT